MKISRKLSEKIIDAKTPTEVKSWLTQVAEEVGGISWSPVGGKMNNIHTVEVSTNPGLALVERPTNSIDAMLDLAHLLKQERAGSPSEAAELWYNVPEGDISQMSATDRRELSMNIALRIMDSVEDGRPTVQIQDRGTGQHPDDWKTTLLSLQESNKKSSMHLMGVYNSGGAASFKFSEYSIIISRRHPELLDGKKDEIGVSIVRYNELDPEKYKTGTYEYCVSNNQDILRLNLPNNELGFGLPRGFDKLEYGTVFRHISYDLDKYSGPAQAPKNSLAHLMGSALPAPVLPLRFYEERTGPRFRSRPWNKQNKNPEWRVVVGNLCRLNRKGVSEYSDRRTVDLGDFGKMILHYHVISSDKQPNNYVSKDQALTIIHNGQRQIIKSRHWVKQKTGLNFLWKRLVIHVDATSLTNIAKRSIFSSTREGGVDSKPLRDMLNKVIVELLQDDELVAIEERDKNLALQNSTRSTSQRLQRRLAREITKRIEGTIGGELEGIEAPISRSNGAGRPPKADPSDNHLPEIPTVLKIINGPLKINPGRRKSIGIEIDAKNGFLPKYEKFLSIEFGSRLQGSIFVDSTGSLFGGKTRVVVYCDSEAPFVQEELIVALTIPELGVALSDRTSITVVEKKTNPPTKPRGGAPAIDVRWVSAEQMGWNELIVGRCDISRGLDRESVVAVSWYLSGDFHSFSLARNSERLNEDNLNQFNDTYAYPICLALFRSELEQEKLVKKLESKGRASEIPSEFGLLQAAIMAHGIATTISPLETISEPDYDTLNVEAVDGRKQLTFE